MVVAAHQRADLIIAAHPGDGFEAVGVLVFEYIAEQLQPLREGAVDEPHEQKRQPDVGRQQQRKQRQVAADHAEQLDRLRHDINIPAGAVERQRAAHTRLFAHFGGQRLDGVLMPPRPSLESRMRLPTQT